MPKKKQIPGDILTEISEDLALILSSVAHQTRLQILGAMLQGSKGFDELKTLSGLGKTALAHHLNKLVENRIIRRIDRGRYALSEDGRDMLLAIGTVYSKSERKRIVNATKRATHLEQLYTRDPGKEEKLPVRIVTLPPMRVASVRVISKNPENDAWVKMRAWAEPKSYLSDLNEHPVFGFNNPNPSPGSPEYGYEFFMKVGPKVKAEGDIKIKKFTGGQFAVLRCNLGEEIKSDFFKKHGFLESWKKLTEWVKSSEYEFSKSQCLEKALDPDATADKLILDLYQPIVKPEEESTAPGGGGLSWKLL
ncbi:MAG: GyrI-like domain-containing protein [Candidatus Ranarchaeia archaeon]